MLQYFYDCKCVLQSTLMAPWQLQGLPTRNDEVVWQHLRTSLAVMKGLHEKLPSKTDAASPAAQMSAYINDRLDIIASAAELAAQCAER